MKYLFNYFLNKLPMIEVEIVMIIIGALALLALALRGLGRL